MTSKERSKFHSIHMMPAAPGFFTVREHEKTNDLYLGPPIVAWQITTYVRGKIDDELGADTSVVCLPITVEGEAQADSVGVQYPDGRVMVFGEPYSDDFAMAFRAHREALAEVERMRAQGALQR